MKRSPRQAATAGPAVAIVIVHFNGVDLIRGCLDSLRKTDYQNFKTFVFDNGSTDRSKEIIQQEFPEAELFSAPKNLGLTRAANEAFALAMRLFPCDYVLFMNDDITVVSSDWLSKLVSTAQKNSQAGIIGCKLLYPDSTIQHGGMVFWPDSLRGKGAPASGFSDTEELDAVSMAASLIRTDVFGKIGGFDEIFSPYYCEDVDFCFRARKSGFRILYAGAVSLHHLEGGSIKVNDEREFVIARNSIILYARYAPLFQFMKMIARIYARLVVRRADRRRDFGRGNFAFFLSPMDLIRLPYRILLMSLAIVDGFFSFRSRRIPSLSPQPQRK
jgi:GT2 family glycosyltransferase